MSRLKFKDDIYTLAELIKLRSLSKLYKEGEVVDEENGNSLDISEIDSLRDMYISELMGTNEKERTIKKIKGKELKQILEEKYKNNTISKEELLSLIKLNNKKFFEISYDDFYIVNCKKERPKGITILEYGRFMLFLDLMSYRNIIEHKCNGKQIKNDTILTKLELNSVNAFNKFIAKLSKVGMVAKTKKGKRTYIHINPTYAKRKMVMDKTIYQFFKEDLQSYLSEYEIRYLEMEDSGSTPSTVEIIN